MFLLLVLFSLYVCFTWRLTVIPSKLFQCIYNLKYICDKQLKIIQFNSINEFDRLQDHNKSIVIVPASQYSLEIRVNLAQGF